MSLAEQVAERLTQSWVAHETARITRRKGDVTGARVLLKEALSHRQAAHQLDPEHTAGMWAEEQKKTPYGKDTHTEMIKFYTKQLDREAL
jgi:hypothetical protein